MGLYPPRLHCFSRPQSRPNLFKEDPPTLRCNLLPPSRFQDTLRVYIKLAPYILGPPHASTYPSAPIPTVSASSGRRGHAQDLTAPVAQASFRRSRRRPWTA